MIWENQTEIAGSTIVFRVVVDVAFVGLVYL